MIINYITMKLIYICNKDIINKDKSSLIIWFKETFDFLNVN